MVKWLFSRVTLVCLFCMSALVNGKDVVTLWSYYDYPPFVIDRAEQRGLSYDFVEMLNLIETDSDFEYQLSLVPRVRLDAYLEQGIPGAVLWVSPIFFNDIEQTQYAWTGVLLDDEQAFISRASQPFVYAGPESLMTKGFVLGGIRGHVYGGIQKYIDAGKITRKDVVYADQNIAKLLKERISSFLIPLSSMRYYEQRLQLSDLIYYSPTPLKTYSRHILVNHNQKVVSALNRVVNNLDQEEYWPTLLEQYGLSLPTK